jgi:hypothetical protein
LQAPAPAPTPRPTTTPTPAPTPSPTPSSLLLLSPQAGAVLVPAATTNVTWRYSGAYATATKGLVYIKVNAQMPRW